MGGGGGGLVFGEPITGLKKTDFKSSYIAVLIKILFQFTRSSSYET